MIFLLKNIPISILRLYCQATIHFFTTKVHLIIKVHFVISLEALFVISFIRYFDMFIIFFLLFIWMNLNIFCKNNWINTSAFYNENFHYIPKILLALWIIILIKKIITLDHGSHVCQKKGSIFFFTLVVFKLLGGLKMPLCFERFQCIS